LKSFADARLSLDKYTSLLDVGCGRGQFIRWQGAIPVRVGIDVCKDALKFAASKDVDHGVVFVQHNLIKLEELFPYPAFEAVIGIDIIEHFDKDQGVELVKSCERIAQKCVLFFVPVGDHPQENCDPWGYGNEYYNAHRSTWYPEDMERLGYEVWHWPQWHKDKGAAMWCQKIKG